MVPLLKAIARGTVGWKMLKNVQDCPSWGEKKIKCTLEEKDGRMRRRCFLTISKPKQPISVQDRRLLKVFKFQSRQATDFSLEGKLSLWENTTGIFFFSKIKK